MSDRVAVCWSWWALVPAALACAAVATPILWACGWPASALVLQSAFAAVCHQRPERSFVLFGGTVAVCVRCLGIYLGAAAGSWVRISRSRATRLFSIAAALNATDAITELTGLHGSWPLVRFVFGCLLGATGAMLVASAALRTSPRATGVTHSVGEAVSAQS